MNAALSFAGGRGPARGLGFALALLSVIVPALPLGPLAASPPLPLAVLWLAYGWAREGGSTWRRPAALFLLGLLQDQLSGGPIGLWAALYVFSFLAGGVFANATRSFSAITDWIGFAGAAAAAGAVGLALAGMILGGAAVTPLIWALGVTVALFPLVRGVYLDRNAMTGAIR